MHFRITLDSTYDLMSCSGMASENASWDSAHLFRSRNRPLVKVLCFLKSGCLVFVLRAAPKNCGVDSVRAASTPSMELRLRLMECAMDH